MVSAMEDVHLEPVMIEDLVKFGEDRGRKAGRKEGRKEGRLVEKWADLRRVLELRKLALTPDQDQRIGSCEDLATLSCWLDQAIVAKTAAEALR